MFKSKNLILGLVLVTVLTSLAYLPLPAQAADSCSSGIKLQVAIPGIGNCVKDFPTYIKTLYKFFISIVGILAVIMIMVGGFQWLLAAGNAQKIAGAKTTILSAIMGLVLALTSYTILYIINPDILKLTFEPEEISLDASAVTEFCQKNKLGGVETFVKNDFIDKLQGDIDGPLCGKTYVYRQLNNEKEEEYCLGFLCPEGEVCLRYNSSGRIKAQCTKYVLINDQQFGYGRQNWWMAAYYLAKSTDPAICANLKVIKREEDVSGNNTFNGIAGCPSGQTCVIYGDQGVNFNKPWSDLVIYDPPKQIQVGNFRKAECMGY